MADISADGPFSSFPGIERWFAVVSGAGVILELEGKERRIVAGDLPLCFDGAATPGCRLVDGPTRDLNLMVNGGRGEMRFATSTPWNGDFRVRALFTAVPGRWSNRIASCDLDRHTLLWDDSAGSADWRFERAGASSLAGWWLGYNP